MLQLHVDTVQLELDQFMMKGIQENLVFFFFLRAPYQLPLKKNTNKLGFVWDHNNTPEEFDE